MLLIMFFFHFRLLIQDVCDTVANLDTHERL